MVNTKIKLIIWCSRSLLTIERGEIGRKSEVEEGELVLGMGTILGSYRIRGRIKRRRGCIEATRKEFNKKVGFRKIGVHKATRTGEKRRNRGAFLTEFLKGRPKMTGIRGG